ncbi:MAG: MotA/TolQ/ExbB proton channel family protein [Thermoguttaceae bacterium]|nr:MotA/TolQ/ExbB proton channel family protein [Thermoguttaceae bacterium]
MLRKVCIGSMILAAAMVCTWTSIAPAQDLDPAAVAAAQEGQQAAAQPVETRTENYFIWVIRSSGFIGFVILCLSMYFIATIIRLFMRMKKEVAVPPDVVAKCEDLLAQRDFKGVYQVVQEDDSYFSRVLAEGIAELPAGLGEAREAMHRTNDAESAEMEKQISMLAVLGTLGPMIGLLGTLKGMISAFSVIAMSDVQLKASDVAGAISEALLLTFEGVALSVPAIYFFAVFRNRVSTISATVMLQADQVLRQFAQAARGGKKGEKAENPAAKS